jgi:monoamine oxidase
MWRLRRALQVHAAEYPSLRARVSRRDLLRATGATVGAALLGGTARRAMASAAARGRIAVVGAGIAGLVTALTLQDAGVPCEIFESSLRVGGRMHSNARFWADGQVSEWCGEFIDSTHVAIRSLAARFGLPLANVNLADPPGSVDTNYFQDGYYTSAELAEDFKAVAPILAAQNAAIGPVATFDRYTEAGYFFDHVSAYDWIEAYVPGGHAGRLGQYLDVATVTENGLDTRLQSSLNLIFPLDSNERYHISGGNEQLPLAIAASLPQDAIHLGWRLTAVAAEPGGRVSLAFATPSGPRTETFDRVILALPFSVLRGLDCRNAGFDARMREAIAQLGYGTNAKLVLQFDDRYWNGRGAWPGVGNGFVETDLPFQSTWDSSRAEAGESGLLTDYTGGDRGASFAPAGPYTTSAASDRTAAYASCFLGQLETVWPGVAAHYLGRAALSCPTLDANLLGSYSTYLVGQYTSIGGYERVRQGQVFFAGEHTSYEFQGFMEGGAESGFRAAQEALATLA